MNDNLIIIGASGHGKVVADAAIRMNKWKSISFLDDNKNIEEFMGIKVIGGSEDYKQYILKADIFVAIGNNDIRLKLQTKLEKDKANVPIIIHPTAIIGSNISIGAGTVILAGVVINSDAKLGKGVIINTGAIVEHDNVIKDFVHISPGVRLAGNVTICDKSWVGIGSCVIQGINIDENSIIGAGTVIISDVERNCTVVGNPGKIIKSRI